MERGRPTSNIRYSHFRSDTRAAYFMASALFGSPDAPPPVAIHRKYTN